MAKKEYNINEDHKLIKQQIKEWELKTDKIIIQLLHQRAEPLVDKEILKECGDILEGMTNEMMSINM